MMQNSDGLNKQVVQTLVTINRLQLKAFNAQTLQNLIFIILNDTYQVFPYDRASLWDLEAKQPKLLGVSGVHKVYKETEISEMWTKLMPTLINPHEPQMLSEKSFPGNEALFNELLVTKETLIFWVPILVNDKARLGFWAEVWKPEGASHHTQGQLEFLSKTLMPTYALVWSKLDTKGVLATYSRNRKLWFYAGFTALLFLFGLRVPLRVAAPCEIAPKQPVVISAPLDGIIDEVQVKSGQFVKQNDLLFQYNKTVPLEELRATQKQVEIAEAELYKANTLGINDPAQLADLEILKFRLEKARVALDLAQTQVAKLDVQAPQNGSVMITDPDDWRGKPVKIGDKVLTLVDSNRTKIKLWIPENDNVAFDPERPIGIILNIDPAKTFEAKFEFISFESALGPDQVPSYLAEAYLLEPSDEVRLGLRGTAILYGQDVSLFYFIVRKPWTALRRFTGF